MTNLFAEERRKLIMLLLTQQGSVSTKDLSQRFQISEVTIRKDLNLLEKDFGIQRAHGGAVLSSFPFSSFWDERELLHKNEKERIGIAAAKLINLGDRIILDSGSTSVQVAKHLESVGDIECLVPDVKVAENARVWANVKVLLAGGYWRGDLPLFGPHTIRAILSYNADKYFLSAFGVSLTKGIRIVLPEVAECKKAMMSVSSEVILIVDSSKFNIVEGGWLCDVKDVDTVITDSNVNQYFVKELEQIGIRVIIV